MNLNLVLFTIHLALVEFVGVLALPQRRDREHQRLVATSAGTLDPNMTSSRSATRVRQQQKQKSISGGGGGEQLPNKTGRAGMLITTESPLPVSCDGQCDVQLCPLFNGTSGRCQQAAVVSDPCRCCNCSMEEVATQQPNVSSRPPVVNACQQLSCPRNKVCLLNIQGLPMCRCPSVYHCKGSHKRPVCTDGNKTFNNKCLVRVEECNSNRRIRILHKGSCPARQAADGRTSGTASRKKHH